MKINISARHFKLTETLGQFIKDKIFKLENFNDILSCNVVLFRDLRYLYVVESKIHGSHFTFVAKSKSKNMYTAIENVVQKLKNQLNKHKDKQFLFVKQLATSGRQENQEG